MKTLFWVYLIFAMGSSGMSRSGWAAIPKHAISGMEFDREEIQKAPEIVFIHGMFMTARCWNGWLLRFKKEGYEVSAPSWPLHEGSVEDLRQPSRFDRLAQLEFSDVLESYRKILREKPRKPILVGHSMGGLVAQILLSEGLAEAAVVLDSAQPLGVFYLNWPSLISNWDIISPFADPSTPIEKSLRAFSYAFTNRQNVEEQARAYRDYYVPESRRVGQALFTSVAEINRHTPRGPLLILAGGRDHIIPARLSYRNFKFYQVTPGYTEFVLYPKRDHWTLAGADWETVADDVLRWIGTRYRPELTNTLFFQRSSGWHSP